MDSRTCPSCGETKPGSEFPSKVYVQKNPKPRRCTRCHKAAKRREYEANKEHRLALCHAAERRRREADREGFLAKRAAWRAKNRDRTRAHLAKWRAAHPEESKVKRRLDQARRRARSGTGVTQKHVEVLKAQQSGRCWWCQKKMKEFHIDHRIPLSRGGEDGPANIVLSCPACNLSKGAKMPWESQARRLL